MRKCHIVICISLSDVLTEQSLMDGKVSSRVVRVLGEIACLHYLGTTRIQESVGGGIGRHSNPSNYMHRGDS